MIEQFLHISLSIVHFCNTLISILNQDAWYGHQSRQLHRQSSAIQEYNPEDVSYNPEGTPSVAVVSASNMAISDFSAIEGPEPATPPPVFSLTGESQDFKSESKSNQPDFGSTYA